MTAPTVTARTRTRSFPPVPETDAPRTRKPSATPAMKSAAASYFNDNKEMNRLKTASEKTRAALYQSMKDAGVSDFEVVLPAEAGANPVTLAVDLNTPTGTEIDPAALYKLMNCATEPKQLKKFLEIVSAAKAAVVEHLGGAVATRCERPTTGRENVKVGAKKA